MGFEWMKKDLARLQGDDELVKTRKLLVNVAETKGLNWLGKCLEGCYAAAILRREGKRYVTRHEGLRNGTDMCGSKEFRLDGVKQRGI